jgi:signal transduction histidine kinase
MLDNVFQSPPVGAATGRPRTRNARPYTVIDNIAWNKKLSPLLVIIAASLTLPITEALARGVFAYLFVLALLFWLARSIRSAWLYYSEIRTRPSALSVKNAVDSLHTGIMLFEQDGFIVLSNTQMQRLMITITGKIRRNGKRFHKMLEEGKIEPRCRITSFEGRDVCLLPDDTAWMFTTNEIIIGKKQYTQATATEISERWKLTEELRLQNEMLTRRRNELSETIDNLHILSRERETQKARMRAHDILGERLTLLMHAVHGEQAVDHAMLRTLADGLLDKLKTGQGEPSPADALEIMKREFVTIGVEIIFDGKIPEDETKGRLFVDIIREAVSNAVRHGLATQIRIHFTDSDKTGYTGTTPALLAAPPLEANNRALIMVISDNGRHASGEIHEGGGITGIREKIKPFGGALNVTADPGFMLTVEIPEAPL